MLITGGAFCVKAIIVKRLALNFHQTAFFDRIEKSLYAEYALKKLMRPRYMASGKSMGQRESEPVVKWGIG